MAHAQKPDLVFQQNGRVHLNWRGASVQSTTGRRAVHISLQVLYRSCKPVFCSHVTITGYPLLSLVSPSLLLPCVTCAITFQRQSTTPSSGTLRRVLFPLTVHVYLSITTNKTIMFIVQTVHTQTKANYYLFFSIRDVHDFRPKEHNFSIVLYARWSTVSSPSTLSSQGILSYIFITIF
jgi:hypothetical protein